MQVMHEKPETIHLYVVREEAPKPQLFPIFLSVLALASLVALSIAVPYEQPVTRAVIRVPAVPLGIKVFTASVAVIPTGIKVYPATTAHGVLTITNGSIIGQNIPADFTVQNVATDAPVYVPPGNANSYGYATVSAHSLLSGKGGNLTSLAINQVISSNIYIRNLSAFSGGRDSYLVKIVTAQDKQAALIKARDVLTLMSARLHYPCSENISGAVRVSWRCQMLTYHIAAFYHVTAVRLSGKNLFISVWFIPRPVRYWVK